MNIDISQDICEGSGIVQLDELGQHMVTYAENMYERGDKFLETINNDNNGSYCWAHVMYKNLICDPIATMEQLYKDFGYEFTDEYKAIMEAFMEEDKKKRDTMQGNKEKLHKYTLEKYGFTNSDIDNKF